MILPSSIASELFPLFPPKNVHLAQMLSNHLTFSWDYNNNSCCNHSVHYKIISDCGACPDSTTSNMITCSASVLKTISCKFAIQTVCCGIFGNISDDITINLFSKGTSSYHNNIVDLIIMLS